MSVQVFLQGQLRGIERFLLAPAPGSEAAQAGAAGEVLLIGRSRWAALVAEVLPRALLGELGLPKILLGSSGAGQFLVILPEEARGPGQEFLERAAAAIRETTGGLASLEWAFTENLGDWSVVRKRLAERLGTRGSTPAAGLGPEAFEPFVPPSPPASGGYFTGEMGILLREARHVGWSPESPARVTLEGGKHVWPLADAAEAIPLARHTALNEAGDAPAGPPELAARAQGRKTWGVLRGNVDNFAFRLRRLQTIEEHVQLSVLYKQFFAGELEVLCSMPEFWRKVTILYAGGNDFAVFGAWDALVLLAREVQRLFHRFNDESLKEIPGAEGKTISMALALAPDIDVPLAEVFVEAGRRLEIAKSTDKDCFHVFGRAVEWRRLAQAGELQENLDRLVREFHGSPQMLGELIRYYDRAGGPGDGPAGRFDRPWRYHRRLGLVAAGARDREYQKLRSKLVAELIGKSVAQATLRPGGRVALEWARLLAEGDSDA